ncbi:hypothetical protein JW859_03755 [bacterium]|nr:hypothetical protein [bacterium]
MVKLKYACLMMGALLLWTTQALALEPAGELEPVKYIQTVDAGTVLLALADGTAQQVELYGLRAPQLAAGTPQAFLAAFYTACNLANAKAVYFEPAGESAADGSSPQVWIWYEHCCRPELVLVNLELVSQGLADLTDEAESCIYAAELATAAEQACRPDLLNLAKLLAPQPAVPVLDLDDLELPAGEDVQWARRAVDINDPATWVAFRRTGDSYIDGMWLNEEFEVFNQSEYFIDFLEVEVRYYCSSGV